MKKPTCKNITEYVKASFKRTGIDNVSIYLPNLNENTFKALKANFKVVNREIWGSIHFEGLK